ncbi:MAG: DUF4180 domain-containing protein [Actinomycetota bacterium]|jgi:hypothetical protein|nr:DUF4180 domain-containing protein [Actinomycetota bacterium]
MEYEITLLNTMGCAYVDSTDLLITDAKSARSLISNIKYECNVNRVAVRREAVIDKFFDASTFMAAELVNLLAPKHYKLAIVGDFSDLEGTPFARFIVRCNQGSDLFFTNDKDTALRMLASAKG